MKDLLVYVLACVVAVLALLLFAWLHPQGWDVFPPVHAEGGWERVDLPPVHRVRIPQTIRKTA